MNFKRSLVSGTKTSTIRKGGANEEGIRFCPIIHDIDAKKPAQVEPSSNSYETDIVVAQTFSLHERCFTWARSSWAARADTKNKR